MITPARLIYHAAGRPRCPKPTVDGRCGLCWLCGLPCKGIGVDVKKAVGQNFTDYASVSLPSSDHVCVPCTWALSGRPPDTLRLWTVVWRTDRQMKAGNPKAPKYPPAHLTAKNDFSEVRGVLLDPPTDGSPWFASIADSGQKHTLPFAKVNFGTSWSVRLEDEDVNGTSADFGGLLFCAAKLYEAGYSRDEISSGNPRPVKLIKSGFDFWREYNSIIYQYRGGGLLRLAILLLQKEHIKDVIRETIRFAPPGTGSEPCAWSPEEREH